MISTEVIKMATSKAQLKANAKYREKLDDIKVRVPKGKREVYKAHAERKGKSLNALIIELLEKICRSIKPCILLLYVTHYL